MKRPKQTLLIAAVVFATTAWPASRLGGEFLPMINEGDLLYMPSALPGLSAAKASELRSEEHTSELQSLMRISYAVFCLKKNKNKHTITEQLLSHKLQQS